MTTSIIKYLFSVYFFIDFLFFIVKLNNQGIIPEEQQLDHGEDLFTEWVAFDKVETLDVDMKTVFLLNLYKNI